MPALTEPPARPISVVLQAFGLLIQRRLINDVGFYADRVELIVLPPPSPVAVSPADFSQARDLIERARSTAGSWLDGGNPALRHPERLLSLHNHSTNTGAPPDAGCLHEPTEMDAPRVFEGGQRDGFIGRISSSRSRPGVRMPPSRHDVPG